MAFAHEERSSEPAIIHRRPSGVARHAARAGDVPRSAVERHPRRTATWGSRLLNVAGVTGGGRLQRTPLVRVSRGDEPRSHARDRLTCQLTCVAGGLRALSGQCVLCFKQVATDNQKSTDSRLNTARSINFKLF